MFVDCTSCFSKVERRNREYKLTLIKEIHLNIRQINFNWGCVTHDCARGEQLARNRSLMDYIYAKSYRKLVSYIVEWTGVFYCACYDSRTICVPMFFVSLNGSDKRSCCKTTFTRARTYVYERVDNYRANGTLLWSAAVFHKSRAFTGDSPRHIFFLSLSFCLFFFILFPLYQTQIRAFFGDEASVYVSLLDVPRCLPFYRDISKAFRISWTIREMFFATICNSSSNILQRHYVTFNYDRGCHAPRRAIRAGSEFEVY